MKYSIEIKKRFTTFVIKTKSCWIWNGARHGKGYGHFQIGSKCNKAHRISYQIFIGPIPDGLHVLHKCDNPSCVNPKHLFVGSNNDNVRDKIKKGRQPRGLQMAQTKLSDKDILEIKKQYKPYKITAKDLANKFNVSWRYISMIVCGARRGDIKC